MPSRDGAVIRIPRDLTPKRLPKKKYPRTFISDGSRGLQSSSDPDRVSLNVMIRMSLRVRFSILVVHRKSPDMCAFRHGLSSMSAVIENILSLPRSPMAHVHHARIRLHLDLSMKTGLARTCSPQTP